MFKIKETKEIVIDSKEFSEYIMLKACSSKFRADEMYSINAITTILNEVSNIIDKLEVKDLRDFSLFKSQSIKTENTEEVISEIEKKVQTIQTPYTYKGQGFESLADLCRFFQKPYSVMYLRIRKNKWSVEDAIDTPIFGCSITDHNGIKYPHIKDMLVQYNCKEEDFKKRKAERPDLSLKYWVTGEV